MVIVARGETEGDVAGARVGRRDSRLLQYNARRLGFTAGVAAALVFLATVAGVRLLTDTRSLVEVVVDGFLLVLPGALGSAIIDSLQTSAKPLLYLGVGVGAVLLGGWLGAVYAGTPTWRRATALALQLWFVFGVVVYTLVGAGPLGASLQAGPWWHGLSLLALFGLYAATLRLTFAWLSRRAGSGSQVAAPAPAALGRRELMRTLGLAGIAALAAGVAWRVLPRADDGAGVAASPSARPAANAAPYDLAGLAPEVTPTPDFYTVSKNFIDPSVNGAAWKLRVDGLVERPLEFTYEDLTALPGSEGFYTLMCISNEVGGDLWGNARWTGVKLAWLLDQAGVKPGTAKVVFSAADDYKDSIKLASALHPDALLAWAMNGEPLTRPHGYPARLLIPNIYGMKNVKWLTGITLVADDFKGYWQTRGWDDSAPYQTASRVDTPRWRDTVAAGTLPVGGVTFAGARGITKVEVSVDSGATWLPAEVKPGLSQNTWQLWRAEVPITPQTRTIRVRATDGLGHLQVREQATPFPAGSTGYHTVSISAA